MCNMKTSILLFGFLAVICSADSPTPFLDAFISGAERFRTRIKDVGSFIGKIANRNKSAPPFGQTEIRHEEQLNQPPPQMNERDANEKTIIVIVEKPEYGYYGQRENQYVPPHNQGPYHGQQHHHGGESGLPTRPGYDEHGSYGNKPWNQNDHNRPNHGDYGQNNEYFNHVPDQGVSENSNKNNEKHQGAPTTEPENKPDFGNTHSYIKHNDNDHTEHGDKTKIPTDQPLRVPLNPNEYIYGGEKIEVNAPKRETNAEDKKIEDEDLEFPIDVRINNK